MNSVQSCMEACASDAERAQLVFVTHSSGNHAAALAHAASLCGARSVIVMPLNAPTVKVAAVKGYGGEVVMCESTQAARESVAQQQVDKYAPYARFIPPYDDARVMSGQGTLALELLEQVSDLDALVVPVGGGGMLAGVCVAAKAVRPELRIYAAEPRDADDAYRSIRAGARIPLTAPTLTVCDGLRTSLGHLTFPIIRRHVSGVITLSEADVIAHMRIVWERMKIIIEASAAVTHTQRTQSEASREAAVRTRKGGTAD
jgi:threonine dehydratase